MAEHIGSINSIHSIGSFRKGRIVVTSVLGVVIKVAASKLEECLLALIDECVDIGSCCPKTLHHHFSQLIYIVLKVGQWPELPRDGFPEVGPQK